MLPRFGTCPLPNAAGCWTRRSGSRDSWRRRRRWPIRLGGALSSLLTLPLDHGAEFATNLEPREVRSAHCLAELVDLRLDACGQRAIASRSSGRSASIAALPMNAVTFSPGRVGTLDARRRSRQRRTARRSSHVRRSRRARYRLPRTLTGLPSRCNARRVPLPAFLGFSIDHSSHPGDWSHSVVDSQAGRPRHSLTAVGCRPDQSSVSSSVLCHVRCRPRSRSLVRSQPAVRRFVAWSRLYSSHSM